MRLQDYVLAQVRAETEKDRDAWLNGLPTEPGAIPKWIEGVKPAVEKTRVRVSDVELMLQVFISRHVDNF